MYIYAIGKTIHAVFSLLSLSLWFDNSRKQHTFTFHHLSLNEFWYWVRHLNYRKPYRTLHNSSTVAKCTFGMQITPSIIITQRASIHWVCVCVHVNHLLMREKKPTISYFSSTYSISVHSEYFSGANFRILSDCAHLAHQYEILCE